MDLDTGVVGRKDMCGELICDSGYECVRFFGNPNHGMTNFDNILYALTAVFQCVTLEGWAHIMVMVQKAFSRYVFLYFVPLVFIGAYFLLNLTLAVIKTEYEAKKKKAEEEKDIPEYSEESEEDENTS